MIRMLRPSFLLLLLATVVAPPAAVRAAPMLLPDPTAAVPELAPAALAATCTLIPGGASSVSFIWTPPEELTSFAWRIPVSACASCASTGLVMPKSVSFRMRWLKACSAQATVSIVGSTAGPTCVIPDPTNVLCGPVTQTISGTGNAIALHTIALPSGSCVPGNAFVLIRFTGLGACATSTTSPGLSASTAPCVPCTQFVTAANIFPTVSEWCSDVGAANATWLSLDVDCCSVVPTIERTWGALKTIYR